MSAVEVLADEIALALQIESNAPDSKWAAQLRRQLQGKNAAVSELVAALTDERDSKAWRSDEIGARIIRTNAALASVKGITS